MIIHQEAQWMLLYLTVEGDKVGDFEAMILEKRDIQQNECWQTIIKQEIQMLLIFSPLKETKSGTLTGSRYCNKTVSQQRNYQVKIEDKDSTKEATYGEQDGEPGGGVGFLVGMDVVG